MPPDVPAAPPRSRSRSASEAALDQLHRVKVQPLVMPHGEDRHDMRVIQNGRDLSLDLEPGELLPGQTAVPSKNLQGHAPAQRNLLGLVDDAHSSPAKLADQPKIANGTGFVSSAVARSAQPAFWKIPSAGRIWGSTPAIWG